MGGRASREKGARRERGVVKELKAAGFDKAQRVPLSGAARGGFSGDVAVMPGVRVEVKGRANGEGWKTLETWFAQGTEGNHALVLIPDRAPWRVYMPWENYVEYLRLKRDSDDAEDQPSIWKSGIPCALCGHDEQLHRSGPLGGERVGEGQPCIAGQYRCACHGFVLPDEVA